MPKPKKKKQQQQQQHSLYTPFVKDDSIVIDDSFKGYDEVSSKVLEFEKNKYQPRLLNSSTPQNDGVYTSKDNMPLEDMLKFKHHFDNAMNFAKTEAFKRDVQNRVTNRPDENIVFSQPQNNDTLNTVTKNFDEGKEKIWQSINPYLKEAAEKYQDTRRKNFERYKDLKITANNRALTEQEREELGDLYTSLGIGVNRTIDEQALLSDFMADKYTPFEESSANERLFNKGIKATIDYGLMRNPYTMMFTQALGNPMSKEEKAGMFKGLLSSAIDTKTSPEQKNAIDQLPNGESKVGFAEEVLGGVIDIAPYIAFNKGFSNSSITNTIGKSLSGTKIGNKITSGVEKVMSRFPEKQKYIYTKAADITKKAITHMGDDAFKLGIAYPTVKGEHITPEGIITGASFGLVGSVTSGIGKTLSKFLRTENKPVIDKLLRGGVAALMGSISFAGGSSLGALATGEEIEDWWRFLAVEGGKGAVLSLVGQLNQFKQQKLAELRRIEQRQAIEEQRQAANTVVTAFRTKFNEAAKEHSVQYVEQLKTEIENVDNILKTIDERLNNPVESLFTPSKEEQQITNSRELDKYSYDDYIKQLEDQLLKIDKNFNKEGEYVGTDVSEINRKANLEDTIQFIKEIQNRQADGATKEQIYKMLDDRINNNKAYINQLGNIYGYNNANTRETVKTIREINSELSNIRNVVEKTEYAHKPEAVTKTLKTPSENNIEIFEDRNNKQIELYQKRISDLENGIDRIMSTADNVLSHPDKLDLINRANKKIDEAYSAIDRLKSKVEKNSEKVDSSNKVAPESENKDVQIVKPGNVSRETKDVEYEKRVSELNEEFNNRIDLAEEKKDPSLYMSEEEYQNRLSALSNEVYGTKILSSDGFEKSSGEIYTGEKTPNKSLKEVRADIMATGKELTPSNIEYRDFKEEFRQAKEIEAREIEEKERVKRESEAENSVDIPAGEEAATSGKDTSSPKPETTKPEGYIPNNAKKFKKKSGIVEEVIKRLFKLYEPGTADIDRLSILYEKDAVKESSDGKFRSNAWYKENNKTAGNIYYNGSADPYEILHEVGEHVYNKATKDNRNAMADIANELKEYAKGKEDKIALYEEVGLVPEKELFADLVSEILAGEIPPTSSPKTISLIKNTFPRYSPDSFVLDDLKESNKSSSMQKTDKTENTTATASSDTPQHVEVRGGREVVVGEIALKEETIKNFKEEHIDLLPQNSDRKTGKLILDNPNPKDYSDGDEIYKNKGTIPSVRYDGGKKKFFEAIHIPFPKVINKIIDVFFGSGYETMLLSNAKHNKIIASDYSYTVGAMHMAVKNTPEKIYEFDRKLKRFAEDKLLAWERYLIKEGIEVERGEGKTSDKHLSYKEAPERIKKQFDALYEEFDVMAKSIQDIIRRAESNEIKEGETYKPFNDNFTLNLNDINDIGVIRYLAGSMHFRSGFSTAEKGGNRYATAHLSNNFINRINDVKIDSRNDMRKANDAHLWWKKNNVELYPRTDASGHIDKLLNEGSISEGDYVVLDVPYTVSEKHKRSNDKVINYGVTGKYDLTNEGDAIKFVNDYLPKILETGSGLIYHNAYNDNVIKALVKIAENYPQLKVNIIPNVNSSRGTQRAEVVAYTIKSGDADVGTRKGNDVSHSGEIPKRDVNIPEGNRPKEVSSGNERSTTTDSREGDRAGGIESIEKKAITDIDVIREKSALIDEEINKLNTQKDNTNVWHDKVAIDYQISALQNEQANLLSGNMSWDNIVNKAKNDLGDFGRVKFNDVFSATGEYATTLKNLAIVGADFIKKGATTFGKWGRIAIKEFGESARTFLQKLYTHSKGLLNGYNKAMEFLYDLKPGEGALGAIGGGVSPKKKPVSGKYKKDKSVKPIPSSVKEIPIKYFYDKEEYNAAKTFNSFVEEGSKDKAMKTERMNPPGDLSNTFNMLSDPSKADAITEKLIGTTHNDKRTIEGRAEKNILDAIKIIKEDFGVISHEERAVARDNFLGKISLAEQVKWFNSIVSEPEPRVNADIVLASQQIVSNQIKKLFDLSQFAFFGDNNMKAYVKQVGDVTKMVANYRKLISSAGRVLNITAIETYPEDFKWIANLNQKAIDRLAKIAPENAADFDEILKFRKDIKKEISIKAKDKALYIFYNLKLLNPLTQVNNLVGNTVHGIYEQILLRNYDRKAFMRGVDIGLRKMAAVYNNDIEITSKWDPSDTKKAIASLIDSKNATAQKIADEIHRFAPTTSLAAVDIFFRSVAEEIMKAKVSKTLQKKYSYTPKYAEEVIEIMRKNPHSLNPNSATFKKIYAENREVAKIMLEVGSISRFAKRTVFQQDLGKMGTAINDALYHVTPLKYLEPFFKIRINMLKAGLENTPIGFIKYVKDYNNMGRVEKGMVLKRAIVGSSVLTGIGYLVGAGIIGINGQGPKDKNKKELWAINNKPNSIVIGDLQIPFGSIEPLASVLRLVGSVSDYIKYDKKTEEGKKSLMKDLWAGIYGLTQYGNDELFVSAMSDINKAFRNEESLMDFLGRTVAGVPVPNIGAFAKKLSGDRTIYELKGMDNDISQLPRYTKEYWMNTLGLPNIGTSLFRDAGKLTRFMGYEPKAKINALGQKKISNWEENTLIGAFTSIKTDNVSKYLLDNNIIIGLPSRETMYNKVQLTDEQYDKFKLLTGGSIHKYFVDNISKIKKYPVELQRDIAKNISSEIRENTLPIVVDNNKKVNIQKIIANKMKYLPELLTINNTFDNVFKGSPYDYSYSLADDEKASNTINYERLKRLIYSGRYIAKDGDNRYHKGIIEQINNNSTLSSADKYKAITLYKKAYLKAISESNRIKKIK